MRQFQHVRRTGMKRICVLFAVAILALSFIDVACAAKGSGKELLAASDGNGSVSLVWMPVNNNWPRGGWRLERIAGSRTTVIAERIGPGLNQTALAKLEPKESDGVREFAAKHRNGSLSADDYRKASFVFALAAAVDQAYGEALGLRHIDKVPDRGKIRYRLVALDGTGSSTVESASIDPWAATPLPPALTGVKAAQTDQGVALTWMKPRASAENRIISYHIERSTPGSDINVLTQRPLLIARNKEAKEAADVLSYTDAKPLLEVQVTYHISGVDAFLRKSPPVRLTVYVKDMSALESPTSIAAKAGRNEVDLTWKANPNQSTAGYVLERSQMASGLFEIVSQQLIPRTAEKYTDRGVSGGSKYYYRLRSVNARGESGAPSAPVAAQPANSEAPPAPSEVKAVAETSRIQVTWQPVAFPVAGYIVERSVGDGAWMRVPGKLLIEPRYDENFRPSHGGRLQFRVVAVAFDNQQSTPSVPVDVILPDTQPPGVPLIKGANGKDGRAVILFEASPPSEDIHQFLVIRGGSAKDMSLVIGDPLSATATNFEDLFVEAGKTYWYQIVAVDKAGNRSDPTDAVAILVGAPKIPKPARPSAAFKTAPFPHNIIMFEPAPFGMLSVVQARIGASGEWKTLSGPARDEEDAADPEPPSGQTMHYRIIYQAPNGTRGEASEIAEVKR